ncbi:carbamoyl-phosphate synthase (glutamine-hydrolyzing) large subunit [Candidatus Gottesmanbacteria bacterium]|nr:carbamoyl-phosphate synthase (glutamine-hydrolyzing) large subunit [Candidatus Gottesmanbacteria bacterium]
MVKKIIKAIILGSGALKIGEAGEFDYSGSQALKALKEEGIKTVLVNPNIATIQTSKELADIIYFLPVTAEFAEKIIIKEKPNAILLGFGGQTALNCGLSLAGSGILDKYKVKVLGTPISAIEKTEDRLLFRQAIENLGLKIPQSILCKSLKDIRDNYHQISYPVIVRAGFSLGGLGSGVARSKEELEKITSLALSVTPQILIEEYLENWKEIEYEVVRDSFDNAIVVCNMENLDPMGIHTGESIVIAPSQTLTNREYHFLRTIAIKVIRSLPIIGECNIQFALNPKTGDYRIIEVNARLSRSSALASKATGYPLAYVAAKLALGYKLSKVPNQVTKKTTSFFEPALDYVVVKIPRWDFFKFKDREMTLGSEMQSVGEVMAIGRSFEEALQKAIRSLDLDYEGIIDESLNKENILKNTIVYKTLKPTPERIFNIASNLFYGQKIEDIIKETGISAWFIEQIEEIVKQYKKLLSTSFDELNKDYLLNIKKLGFSDKQIGRIFDKREEEIRRLRKSFAIIPKVCQIDTLAGEFPAQTNYLYLSYHRDRDDDIKHLKPAKQIAIIGGGPYQIGSSVEFDWCAVNTARTLKRKGFSVVMINCNPETVSTDYDISDKLFFEELTLERILDIYDLEKCPFIVSVGGQIPNTLAPKLVKKGIKILGTQGNSIDKAENREKFSHTLDTLRIPQPEWASLNTREEAIRFSRKIGFPVLIRPSYVLSGRAMQVVYSENQLLLYLNEVIKTISGDYPVVISKFIKGSKEVDFDAVAQNGNIKISAISEHVEHAGVHSGDATLVLPSFSLSPKSMSIIKTYAAKISKSSNINGPFNIQFIVKENGSPEILVIEANLRASRSFPFVSKILGINFIEIATLVMLGKKVIKYKDLVPSHMGVKVPHFSFTRLRRVDPTLRVEMASTGEVASFGATLEEAYLKGVLSTGIKLPQKSALLSLGGLDGKTRILPAAKTLHTLGFDIYATNHTRSFLKKEGIPTKAVFKVHEGKKPNVVDLIRERKVDLVINISDKADLPKKELILENTDGFLIRRAAVDTNIPLFTKPTIANLFVKSLSKNSQNFIKIKSWEEYV